MNNIDEEVKLNSVLVHAYVEASTKDVPDLWDRIKEGYIEEYNSMKSEGKTARLTALDMKQKISFDIIEYRSRVDLNRIEDRIDKETGALNKVVSFEKVKPKKNISKWIGLAAAAILLCVIAIPVAKSGLLDNKKIDDNTNVISDNVDNPSTPSAVSDEFTDVVSDINLKSTSNGGVATGLDISNILEDVGSLEVKYIAVINDSKVERLDSDYIITVNVISYRAGDCKIEAGDKVYVVNGDTVFDINNGEIEIYDEIKINNISQSDKITVEVISAK